MCKPKDISKATYSAPIFPLAMVEHALGTDLRRRFVAVAPNGGRLTPNDHPALPITPSDLAQTAKACLEHGAAMMHVHVRDEDGRHSLDADAYRDAIAAIKTTCGDDLLLQITTEALGVFTPDIQIATVKAVRPEAASLGFRELVRDDSDADEFAALLRWMENAGIAAQIIVYDTSDLERFRQFLEHFDIAPHDMSVLYVLGRYVETSHGLQQLNQFTSAKTPVFRDVMVCAFGVEETACITAAAILGANVRVGFENNTLTPDGTPAVNNAARVKTVQNALGAVGLRPGDAHALRRLWLK